MTLTRPAAVSLAAAVIFAVSLGAQDTTAARNPREAQPERPTVATHAGTVSPGLVEFESGLEFDARADRGHNGIAVVITKFGVTPHLQFSVYTSAFKFSDAAGGLGDVAMALKWRVLDRHAVFGDFAIQPLLKFPTGSSAAGSGTGTTDAQLLLISSREVGPVHVDLNAGVTWRSGNGTLAPTLASVWTASFGGVVRGPVGWCAELFGYPATSGPAGSESLVALLVGPWFEVNPSVVIDVGVIVPVRGAQPRALYLGVTWNAGRPW